MVRREKVAALILSRQNSGEADRRIMLLTREHGLLHVTAKGVRRIPSRRGGHLEPFTQVLAIITGHPHRRYLAASETIDNYQALYQDPSALQQVQNVAHLMRKLLGHEMPHPALFDALLHTCHDLPALSTPKRHLLEVALILLVLEEAGQRPALDYCSHCRTREPDAAVLLSADFGGWQCLPCLTSFHGTHATISPRLLRAVRWLAHNPHAALRLRATPDETQQLITALRQYIVPLLATQNTPHLSPSVVTYAQ